MGGRIDRSHYPIKPTLNPRPTGGFENYDGHTSFFEILLVLQVAVRGDEHLEPRLFRSSDQFAILEAGSTTFVSGFYDMGMESVPQWGGRSLVEKNFQSGFCQ